MEEEVLSVISKYTPPNSPYKRFTVDEIKASTKKPKAKRVKKESPLKVHKDTDVTTEKTDVMSPVIPNSDAFKSDLSSEQLAAAQRALRGNNVFITGAAGTGKSHVLRYIVQELRKMHGSDCVFPVAPTGIAAINIGGSTVHSFAGIGLGMIFLVL
jgi:ATP-dependent DNA helicase PIF1